MTEAKFPPSTLDLPTGPINAIPTKPLNSSTDSISSISLVSSSDSLQSSVEIPKTTKPPEPKLINTRPHAVIKLPVSEAVMNVAEIVIAGCRFVEKVVDKPRSIKNYKLKTPASKRTRTVATKNNKNNIAKMVHGLSFVAAK
jgi:hypothetical protein